ncbi:hypothetical protein KJ966_06930 [bacterium]|nr:hypothetical protein [bacterium]
MQASINKGSETMGIILAEIMKTAEMKKFTRVFTGEILDSWAGEKAIRKKAAGFLTNRVENLLSTDETAATGVQSLFKDPEFMKLLTGQIPNVIQGTIGLLETFFREFEKQSPELKIATLTNFANSLATAQTGEIFGSIVGLLKTVQTADKHFLPRLVESMVSNWITKVDFGELKELLETSQDSMIEAVKACNSLIWKYPAKLVILLSFVPFCSNTLLKSLTVILSGFNQAPPDLVADIVLSLIKEINPDDVSDSLNNLFELARKIETGSALVGDPGTPRLAADVSSLLTSVLSGLDETIMIKARLALLKDWDKIKFHLFETLFSEPERLHQHLSYRTARSNSRLQSLNQKLKVIEDLQDQEFDKLLQSMMTDLDKQELSEVVESSARLLERISLAQPDLLAAFSNQIVQQVDLVQLQEMVLNLGTGLEGAIKPLGRAILPRLVMGVCEILKPEEDEFEDQAAEARKALRFLLLGNEGQL